MVKKIEVAGQDKYNFPKTKEILNQLVADLSQMNVNLHQVHWYIRGTSFLRLHPLMDDYMDEIDTQLDEVAERLIEIGGAPFSSTAEFAAHTGLPEEPGAFNKYTQEEYVARLVNQFGYLRDVYQKGMDITDEEKDLPTQDLLNGYKAAMDKNIWMLQAYLGNGPFDD